MLSAKSIMLNGPRRFAITFSFLFLSFISVVRAQDNSPYSRFGLGNMMPLSNTGSRGMGGVSAAYVDYTGINFLNPASYAAFLSSTETKSKKMESGRAILDVGLSITNRTLIAPNTPNKFTSSDLLFSYLQLGVPLRKNWGLSFGIRPVSRINYRIDRSEMLKDPVTGDSIANALTQFRGDGGSYLPTIGTGFGFNLSKKETAAYRKTSTLRLGANLGYLFGNRETKTLRNLADSISLYYASNHSVTSSFGDLFVNAGMQYQFENRNEAKKQTTYFRLGISGNWKQKLSASQDRLVQTYSIGSAGEELQIDSIFEQRDMKGDVIFPTMYRAGFMIQRVKDNFSGWMVGADFSQGKWSEYRFFGQQDSVQDNWEVSVGAAFNGKPGKSYFSNVTYRIGFYTGPDYIKVKNELPQFGVSLGMGLPLRNYNRLTNQSTLINVAFEYGKRGNNDNVIKENLFRFSVGFNFNDVWFRKRKYD